MQREYIERKALIARYDAEHVGPPGRARELMVTAPAADVVEVRHGRWIRKEDDSCYWYECSGCGEKLAKTQWGNDYFSAYCPNCGVLMDKEEEQ